MPTLDATTTAATAPARPDDVRPLELVVSVGGREVAFRLPRAGGRVTVGRATDNDVTLNDRSISRRHAVLEVAHEGVRLTDLGSANGTSLARARGSEETTRLFERRLAAHAAVRLELDTPIRFGSVPAIVRAVPAGAAASAPIVRDAAMVALYELIDTVAPSDLSVLLLGETGVGKEVLAEAIHTRSRRANSRLLRLNCAALSETLLESELFGHEKGAFTGAVATKPGLLETADGGTVFLDEVGELPLATQVKLLRVLESREVTRVGGLRPRAIDVRFVAATNRDLPACVAAGTFRGDLYFRLDGITLEVPPLRERPGEIVALAEAFLARAAGAHAPALSPEACAALAGYRWPGNVRELRNVVERAALLCRGDTVRPEHLMLPAHTPRAAPATVAPPPLPPAAAATTVSPAARAESPPSPPAQVDERARILDALEKCGGNQTRAAALLGVSRRTLVSRLTEYDLPRPRKR